MSRDSDIFLFLLFIKVLVTFTPRGSFNIVTQNLFPPSPPTHIQSVFISKRQRCCELNAFIWQLQSVVCLFVYVCVFKGL